MPEAPSLFQQLLDQGEAVKAALENDEVARLPALLDERGALLDELRAFDHPAELDADWKTYRRALVRQHVVLQEALGEQKERLTEALNDVEQYKDAQRRYDADEYAPQLLHPDLRG